MHNDSFGLALEERHIPLAVLFFYGGPLMTAEV